MSDDVPKNWKSDFAKKIKGAPGQILAAIAFASAVIGITRLLELEIKVTVLLLTLTTIWLASIYFFFKKKTDKISSFRSGNQVIITPLYPKWMRWISICIAAAIPIVLTIYILHWKYQKKSPENKIIVLVADFEGKDQDYVVTETILRKLRKIEQKYSDISIVPLRELVTERDGGSEFARTKGRERNAAIVIWGTYNKTNEKVQVNFHFELLQKLKNLPVKDTEATLKFDIKQLEKFEFQESLSNETNHLVLLTVGMAREQAKDHHGGIAALNELIEQPTFPGDLINAAEVFYARGVAYYNILDDEKAISDFKQALSLKPDMSIVYNILAATYIRKEDLDQALSCYNKALDIEPNPTDYNNRGAIYLQKSDSARALEDFNKAITLDPTDADLYVQRGIALILIKDYDKAISSFSKAISLNPNSANAYCSRGATYSNKGELQKALSDFNHGLQIQSDDPNCYENRGEVYSKLGDLKRSVADYSQAVKYDPNNFRLLLNRARAYFADKKYEQAIFDLNRVVEMAPKLNGNKERGFCYLAQGKYDLAIADFEESLKRLPDDFDVYIQRATANIGKGEIMLAIEDFGKAISIKPNDANTFLNRGKLYFISRKYQQAIDDFGNAAKRAKDDKTREEAQRELQLTLFGRRSESK